MAYTLAPSPWFTGLDESGLIISGGLLYTVSAGGSYPTNALSTFSDSSGTLNSNPIVLDSAGRATIYLLPTSYKFILKTADGATIREQDNISSVPPTDIDNDVTGTAGEALTAGQVAYLSDGSGALTAGRWYKGDADLAYGSTLPQIAFVVADIAAGSSGTFRLSGRVTGLSGLTPGANYYISTTAGQITATAPSNSRFVGQADGISTLIATPNPPLGVTVPTALCQGRLTVTTGVPVTTADVTAATTIFWAPYSGYQMGLYDGNNWVLRAFTQLSIAVPATTNTIYDVFVFDNVGTPALELLAWTNDTTRATALIIQDGIYVKTGALTRRYLGSFRTTAVSGQTEDSAAKRYVWNYYNRVPRVLTVKDTTVSWTYTTATWRQARATATNQVECIVGVQEVELDLTVAAMISNTNALVPVQIAIGEDSTSVPLNTGVGGFGTSQVAVTFTSLSPYRLVKYPAVGRHFYAWLEISSGTGTTTWYGQFGFTPALDLSGITGRIWG